MRFLIFLLIFLPGCTTLNNNGWEPYGSVALGSQIDRNTDYWVQTERPDQCSKNVKFYAEGGLQHSSNLKIGYRHQSWLLCGGPFNSDPEIYADDILIIKEFGGH